ncbi:acyltransferase family protein [Aquabacterium sp. A7-Y]|uniref:acyltransferase family protein n=1 Tax=Aquabacterium sp. A7-Y TaxID=1349605 RepID=UPI00223E36FC|nr:acyltransferase family protein [Aquabacterium sp. A7-Y]MCW7538639.1 acyltransferase family protein [Aquabacterium sp. A7-Y]
MDTASSSAPPRLLFLDWVRIAAFALLVLYHVGMYYVRWDFHVKSPYASGALEPFMRLSSPWRLGLLFLVSGAATSLMLARRPAGLVRSRSKRLLLPLLCGMAVVVPPQSYLEVVEKFGYAGSYADFLRLYFEGHRGFCREGRCLVLPTWNHLWFLPYLWVYTLGLWALCRLWPQALQRLADRLGRSACWQGPGLLLWPIVVLALLRLLLAERFPTTHALLDDWANHAVYFGLFVLGAVLARLPAIWPAMAERRWLALGLGLAAWVLFVACIRPFDGGMPPEWLRPALRGVYAVMQWCGIVAVLGFAARHWNREHPLRQRLSEAVFPVYILHQTVLVVLAHALQPLRWTPALEGPLLVVATFVLSFAGYELLRRFGWLRPWFGMAASRQRAGITSPSRPAAKTR